ncbi:hypothetical protein E9840_04585 [Tissierella creatinini]|nr:hypothetical protein E9840_04585 [Tissierella creatinini]TJX60656.1 hypothetical protein E8P77_19920 [Soehngenia saccharolytica]
MDKIIALLNKDTMSSDDRLELLDELYWADFNELGSNHPQAIKKIFLFLRKDNFSIEEISLIQKLYSNPDGAYIEDFSPIIINLYKLDKIKFIKALYLNIDQAENLAYLFRNNKVFEDEDRELEEILATKQLTREEEEAVEAFFKMYKKICRT